jgi:3-hydroxyphenylacetate 6-hydroxylase
VKEFKVLVRAGSTNEFQSSAIIQEAIFVEEAIGKLRSVGMNYSNYIPSLRFVESISKTLTWSSKPEPAKAIGQRRADYKSTIVFF